MDRFSSPAGAGAYGESASNRMTRRQVLGLGAASAATIAAMSCFADAATAASLPDVRSLSFTNLHTGEKVKVTYHAEGHYIPDAISELDKIMRDPWDHSVKDMDKRLYDLLFTLHRKLDVPEPFMLISGYRSPKTNAILAARSAGVAKRSYHMRGWAADVRLKSRSVAQIANAAMSMRRGGVGKYTRSNFVHVDVGPFRRWGV